LTLCRKTLKKPCLGQKKFEIKGFWQPLGYCTKDVISINQCLPSRNCLVQTTFNDSNPILEDMYTLLRTRSDPFYHRIMYSCISLTIVEKVDINISHSRFRCNSLMLTAKSFPMSPIFFQSLIMQREALDMVTTETRFMSLLRSS